jgi:uncharacterized protein YndB with AHSA1/START domain
MSKSYALDSANIRHKLDVITYFFSHEMTIDSPVQNVWHHMLNYHEWNPDHIGAKVERLAGAKNEEGEVILEYKWSGDGYASPTIIETIKVIPTKKIVWALYMPDSGASNEIGFVDFSLQESNGKTVFVYSAYGWGNSSAIGNDKAAFHDSVEAQLNKLLPTLKAYVEGA